MHTFTILLITCEMRNMLAHNAYKLHDNSSTCYTKDEFAEEFKEGTDVDTAQDDKFFKDLNKKQCERAITRLQDALNRIEEVTQEAEVMSISLRF